MEDREQAERRIAAFVSAGLDDFRIRAWTVIRGAYLRPGYADPIRALLEPHGRSFPHPGPAHDRQPSPMTASMRERSDSVAPTSSSKRRAKASSD